MQQTKSEAVVWKWFKEILMQVLHLGLKHLNTLHRPILSQACRDPPFRRLQSKQKTHLD